MTITSTEPYTAAASRAKQATERGVEAFKKGAKTFTDQATAVAGLPTIDLTEPVPRYFDLVQKTVDLNRELATRWAELFNSFSDTVRDQAEKAGHLVTEQSEAVSDLAVHLSGSGGLADAVGRAATVLVETLVDHSEERLLLGGTANLAHNTADFGGSLRSVMEALEEQVVVLRLLAAQQEAGRVTVRIGHETEAEQMAGTSVVTTTYGSSGKVYGGMGVLGPTRMDYPGTIANVAAVALYIGEVLGSR